ncbi:MAG: membrane dipeptidase [Clostridia bacterium]|nr:membrane dipeptidase [Clostridia bacterium]
MKYVDLHCDALTAAGEKDLTDASLQAGLKKLKNGECAVQCFAIFTQGDGAALCAEQRLSYFAEQMQKFGKDVLPVRQYFDFAYCLNSGITGAVLTIENLGFIGDDLKKIEKLAASGVKMASLVWNFENSLAYPNLKFDGGKPLFSAREDRGLKPLGKQAVEVLDGAKIIIDISHLSDGGAYDILEGRKIPIVASHSNAAAVWPVCRNLTDELIKKIADCGGVVGVNYCKDFLGEGETFDCVLRHINNMIKVVGEDLIALGSDFDGIPAPPDLEDSTKVPYLLSYLSDNGISGKLLEKLCYKNFARVFREVCT